MATAVNVYVNDDSVAPAPIAGVTVGVFDPTTFALIASAVTDNNGLAAFLLPGAVSPGTGYELRFFKLGVIFANPKQIKVIEPADPQNPNGFTMTGTLPDLPVATDPRLCRCQGRFVDFSNQPLVGRLLRLSAKGDYGYQNPKIVDGNLVPQDAIELYTDQDGFITVDLFRTGEYYVMFAGEDDATWNLKVPDRVSANLVDLIHPQPVSLTWDQTIAPGNVVTIHVGEMLTVPMTVLFSDYEEVTDDLSKWFILMNSDNTIMDLGQLSTPGSAVVTGIAPGVAEVTVQLHTDLLPVRIPTYSISAPTLQVTVVP